MEVVVPAVGVAVRFVAVLGAVEGVTNAEAAEAAPVPPAVAAATLKV